MSVIGLAATLIALNRAHMGRHVAVGRQVCMRDKTITQGFTPRRAAPSRVFCLDGSLILARKSVP
jgi:hypothetical protein